MKARLVRFGEIEVEGERYTHDVVIERKYRVRNGDTAYGNQTFSYITITGASWKGTIGHLEADITLADATFLRLPA